MEKSILKNTIYKLVLEFLRVGIPLITIPYIYRIFKPEVMGRIEISQAIITYFSIFAGYGVYNYGLREISYIKEDNKKKNKVFTELFIISFLSSILVSFIYCMYIFFMITEPILRKILMISVIQIFSYAFFLEWVNEAFENYKFISLKTIIVKIINFLCILYFIKKEEDIYTYIFLISFFMLLNNIISCIYIKKYIKFEFKSLELKKYLKPLTLIIVMTNSTILYTLLDRTFLSRYINDLEEIAYYGMAYKILGVLTTVITSAILVSVPRLSFYIGEKREEDYKELFSNLLSYTTFFLYPVGIGLVILSKEIVLLFGGNNYIGATNIMIFFSIRFIIATIQSIISRQVLFVYKKEKILTNIYLICGLLNLIFKIFLLKFNLFNAVSAIITTSLAELGILIISIIYIKEVMKLKMKILKLKDFKYLVISSLFFIVKLLPLSNKIQYKVLEVIFFNASIYIIILFLIKDEIIFEILKNIKRSNK